MGDFDGFMERAEEVRAAALAMKQPLLVNHYDCDGITSGAIASAALTAAGVKHTVKTVRKVDDALIDELMKEKEIIFTDLGGGSPRVNELPGNVAIIDHHQTEGVEKLQVNPHMFGFDGGTEISASGTAYFVFREKIEIAIVGAIGDMQYPLASLNRRIMAKGEEEGRLKSGVDLRMYGRHSRPLPQLLAYADDPYLPGLGGHEDRCAQFLEGAGIGKIGVGSESRWPTYASLALSDKQKLVGALAIYLAEGAAQKKQKKEGGMESGADGKNISLQSASTNTGSDLLVGETYLLLKYSDRPELYDAGEFSTMLNACGRHGRPELGMGICLGMEGAYEEGRKLLAEHRRQLREGIEFAYKNTRDYGPFLLLNGMGAIEDGIIGVVAGMMYPGGRTKPIVALALDETGKIKVSTRGTKKLVGRGLNLGLALKVSCAKVGGVGGGHKIAAGASIPKDGLDGFLKAFAEEISGQGI